jgi:integrase
VAVEQAVIRVRSSYTGGMVGTPKNRERGDVDLISDVVDLLTSWRDKHGCSRSKTSYSRETTEGGFFRLPSSCGDTCTQQWLPLVSNGQVRHWRKRTFYSFRHTFAKRALENGAQITWLSRHLGHSSPTVTTDNYGHWERAERKNQAAKMEGAFPV